MLRAIRDHLRATTVRRDSGEVDPVLVLVSLGVLALVIAGIVGATIHAQRWSNTYAADASEQTSEDASRLSWMADVGTATAVVPAAKAGTTAATSVRFDSTTRETSWPAAATCRTVTWWLENTTANPKAPNARDAAGNLRAVTNVHRELAYYAGSTSGKCNTAVAPVSKGLATVAVRNAEPGAQFSYVNGHLRDLVYPNTADPSREACAGVAKTDTAGLAACTAKSEATIVPQRTTWEWADSEPVQVLLEMETDQAGAGEGYGTQIGWRETTGRRELTGDPSSPVVDTLANPPAPAQPAAADLTVAVIKPDSTNSDLDHLDLTRKDARDLDGYEYQCVESLNGVDTGTTIAPTSGAVLTTGPAPETVVVPGTRAGYAYLCSMRGWVTAVTPAAQAGQRFAGGNSPWRTDSAVKVRRPTQPTFTVQGLNANGTATFAWGAVVGATSYDFQYRLNSTGTWTTAASTTATSWTSPVLDPDTRVYLRIRAVNTGGASGWVTANVIRALEVPAVSIEAGAIGKSSYTASWPNVPGFDPAVHKYEVLAKLDSAPWPTSGVQQTTTTYTITGVEPGHTAHIRVRAVGVNAGSSAYSAAVSATRPVQAPAAPSISVENNGSGFTTYASGPTCESGVTLEYNVWDGVQGWRGWSTDNGRIHPVNEGSSITVTWKARCVPTVGTAVEGPEAGTGTLSRPWSVPAVPTMNNPTDGNQGTNIRFSWSDTGGYYQVANAAGSHRAYTTAAALTILREAGQTCAQVRAAKSQAAANAGAWSNWSSTQCGATIVPQPPATPAVAAKWSPGLGQPGWIAVAQVKVTAVAAATSYQAYVSGHLSTGAWVSSEVDTVSAGVFKTLWGCQTQNFVAVSGYGRAGNANGWSGWGTAGAPRGAQVSSCN